MIALLSLVMAISSIVSASAYIADKTLALDLYGTTLDARFYLYVYKAEREMGDLWDEIEAETNALTLSDEYGDVTNITVQAYLDAYNPDFDVLTPVYENPDGRYVYTGSVWTFNAHEAESYHSITVQLKYYGYINITQDTLFHDFVNYE